MSKRDVGCSFNCTVIELALLVSGVYCIYQSPCEAVVQQRECSELVQIVLANVTAHCQGQTSKLISIVICLICSIRILL